MRTDMPPGWRVLSLATAVITFLGLLVGLAAVASASSRPVASASVSVDGSDAVVTVTVNRGPKQIRSATCQVDGTTVDCGAPTLASRKAVIYGVQLTGLDAGEHTFTITIRLTDVGRATGSAVFETAGTLDQAQVCQDLGGSPFTEGWTFFCSHPSFASDDEMSSFMLSFGADACLHDTWGGSTETPGLVILQCPIAPLLGFHQRCLDSGVESGGRLPTSDKFECLTLPDLVTDAGFASFFEDLCASLGGSYTETPGTYELSEALVYDSLTYTCTRVV